MNSQYDTTAKTLEFLNKNKGEFANTTIYAPILHELGHCYYENCVKQLAKSRRIAYNKAKDILDERIQDFIHNQIGGSNIKKLLSHYALIGYDEHKYTEIVAECFSIKSHNNFATSIVNLINEGWSQ